MPRHCHSQHSIKHAGALQRIPVQHTSAETMADKMWTQLSKQNRDDWNHECQPLREHGPSKWKSQDVNLLEQTHSSQAEVG